MANKQSKKGKADTIKTFEQTRSEILSILIDMLVNDLKDESSLKLTVAAKLKASGINTNDFYRIPKTDREVSEILDRINLRRKILKQIQETRKFLNSKTCTHRFSKAASMAIAHKADIERLLKNNNIQCVFHEDLIRLLHELKSTLHELTLPYHSPL